MKELDRKLFDKDFSLLAGIDEVGRGCGSGPMVMSSVILPKEHNIEPKYLRDSKKMTAKMREAAVELIYREALDVVVVEVPEGFIDKWGINEATREGVGLLARGLKVKPDILIIDGKDIHYETYNVPYICVEKGEDKSENVAVSSVVAKTYRDNLMKTFYHKLWPEYNFDKNKGYLTKDHIEALEKYGHCHCHRISYMVKGKLIGNYKNEV